ncbi:lipid droplet-associated hydrolase isoform X2 [Hyla sarda]|nr:lipid droplet-associated hydrolase isoform X2 [Hyla sarda]XP_056420260.1 lipid droplet-associated hydrolase isoform X2 [Hyla sarda]XP_056420261.1 lipid droplet-associated hydrolase isoform X2 [Hyla sarda]XP_056420262.1 lipid droplet-associated hydrolase isoform X2 [Hyla sarda]
MSEENIPIHDEIVYCLGAATQVLKCGPWRDLHKTSNEAPPKLLFFIITGNPGVVGFYRTFIQSLYCGFKGKYPVWAISHAGHCSPPTGMDLTDEHDHQIDDVFGLNGQIEHKLFFLKQSVPADIKLVLIGHSIGCYIILEMMKRSPELKVLKSILLFPTIERMAESPQGKLVTPWLCNLRYVVYMPLYLLSFLPEFMKTFLVKLALHGLKSVDEPLLVAALNLFNIECAANGMYLGSQEMVKVVERDNATIKQHLNKLIIYYGATDRWCPVQYYEDIKKDFPKGNIWLCNKGYRHAFVLDSSKEVASLVVTWMSELSSSKKYL